METFPALTLAGDWLAHGFVRRIPGVAVTPDKAEVLAALRPHHEAAVEELGYRQVFLAEQVHGADLAVVREGSPLSAAGVDGLLTNVPGVLLGIHVADCGPVYVVDPVHRAIALLHSGRKGTELGITARAIARMAEEFGSCPADLVVQLGPCIRPPRYEVGFASQICQDAVLAGVPAGQVHDCGLCTGADTDRYYSYRMERGCTGRLLALLGIRAAPEGGAG